MFKDNIDIINQMRRERRIAQMKRAKKAQHTMRIALAIITIMLAVGYASTSEFNSYHYEVIQEAE